MKWKQTKIWRTKEKEKWLPLSNAFDSYGAFLELHEIVPFGELQNTLVIKIHPKSLVPQNEPLILDKMSKLQKIFDRIFLSSLHFTVSKLNETISNWGFFYLIYDLIFHGNKSQCFAILGRIWNIPGISISFKKYFQIYYEKFTIFISSLLSALQIYVLRSPLTKECRPVYVCELDRFICWNSLCMHENPTLEEPKGLGGGCLDQMLTRMRCHVYVD